MRPKLNAQHIKSRLIKICGACRLIMVRRPKQTILQRIERGIEMQVPKHFTLNDVWEIMMEIAEVAPWAEDYIRQKGALFICYREDLAKKLALSGFLYKKRRRISIYQHWGEAAAA